MNSQDTILRRMLVTGGWYSPSGLMRGAPIDMLQYAGASRPLARVAARGIEVVASMHLTGRSGLLKSAPQFISSLNRLISRLTATRAARRCSCCLDFRRTGTRSMGWKSALRMTAPCRRSLCELRAHFFEATLACSLQRRRVSCLERNLFGLGGEAGINDSPIVRNLNESGCWESLWDLRG